MKIIKYVIDDIVSDLKFIKDLFIGKINISKRTSEIKKELKKVNKGFLTQFLKDNWVWILFCIGMFLVGMWYGGLYYQIKFNEAVVNLNCINHYESILNQSLNFS